MPQKDVVRTTGTAWDFLEPAINPSFARTMHGKIKASSTGTYVIYYKGQIMRQKDDGSNEWAKDGTSGYTLGRARIIKYTIIVNDAGYWQYGTSWLLNGNIFEGTLAMYYQGYFKCQDLIGKNEVQTETMTATGGTRTLTVINPVTGQSATTGAIAYNANAATIQAALEALANVDVGDVVVTGTGPYVYTFGGNFAGRDVPLIVIGTGSLTGGSSSMAQTGPISLIGQLVSGNYTTGILELGAATPA